METHILGSGRRVKKPKEPKKPRAIRCSACLHSKRPAVDKDLILGMSYRECAEKYGVHRDVMYRHNNKCIDEARRRKVLAQQVRDEAVNEQQEIAGTLNEERVEVQGGLKKCIKEIERILEEAKDDKDKQLQLSALREMRSALIDLAKIMGTLKQSLTVNVALTDSPEWLELRSILVEVFNEHPGAGRMFVERARKLNVALPSPR